MSGGHYNYTYFRIMELAEDIQRDAEDEDQTLSEEMRAKMLEMAAELTRTAAKAKALEWYMSGDTLEADFLEFCQR